VDIACAKSMTVLSDPATVRFCPLIGWCSDTATTAKAHSRMGLSPKEKSDVL
jgi:hypothetical protein